MFKKYATLRETAIYSADNTILSIYDKPDIMLSANIDW